MRILPFLLLFAFTVQISFAQTEDSIFIMRISDEILTNRKAYENLRHLTTKIGARLAGSPGMVKSEQWGLKVMQESGAHKAWMQECMVPHWVRGGKDIASAAYIPERGEVKSGPYPTSIKKELDIVALGNSVGTGNNALTAQVVLVNSFEELEKKKDEVKDKIVFYNYKFNPTYINT